jgi:hypothetical protein
VVALGDYRNKPVIDRLLRSWGAQDRVMRKISNVRGKILRTFVSRLPAQQEQNELTEFTERIVDHFVFSLLTGAVPVCD